ncbi:MAG: DUF2017 family protein [Acidimicrobiales bacterium]|nr:DUF2017 family protein [Acidimicrobiales bacterium]
MASGYEESQLEVVTRTSDGKYKLHLPDGLMELLGFEARELSALLSGPDSSHPNLMRLHPQASLNDFELASEFKALADSQILESHKEALKLIGKHSSSSMPMTGEELDQYLRGVNAIRLAIGSAFDISDETDFDLDPDDEGAQPVILYSVFTSLASLITEALLEDFPAIENEDAT